MAETTYLDKINLVPGVIDLIALFIGKLSSFKTSK